MSGHTPVGSFCTTIATMFDLPVFWFDLTKACDAHPYDHYEGTLETDHPVLVVELFFRDKHEYARVLSSVGLVWISTANLSRTCSSQMGKHFLHLNSCSGY